MSNLNAAEIISIKWAAASFYGGKPLVGTLDWPVYHYFVGGADSVGVILAIVAGANHYSISLLVQCLPCFWPWLFSPKFRRKPRQKLMLSSDLVAFQHFLIVNHFLTWKLS